MGPRLEEVGCPNPLILLTLSNLSNPSNLKMSLGEREGRTGAYSPALWPIGKRNGKKDGMVRRVGISLCFKGLRLLTSSNLRLFSSNLRTRGGLLVVAVISSLLLVEC